MKPSTRRKTLLAVVMTLIMSLAFAGTAFAATITIKQDSGKVAGHTYSAYQIFKGTYEKGNTPAEDQLTNIQWADGVDSVSLLAELEKGAFTYKQGDPEFVAGMSAAEAAAVLNAFGNDDDNAKLFADIVAKSKAVPAVGTATAGEKDKSVTIPKDAQLPDGYYVVIDETEKMPEGDTATRFLLKAIGGEDDFGIDVKASTTESHKSVEEDSLQKYQDYADAEIGQVVNFQLTATIPTNLDSFKNYWVQFQDTLSKGLTLDEGSFKVVTESNNILEPGLDYVYASENATDENQDTYFTLTFGKKPEFTGAVALSDKIKPGDKIIVTYQARLNENAIIGIAGNPNEFKTIYSTNPNDEDGGTPGETPPEKVFVFTWELDNVKIDGADKTELANAEFRLYKGDGQNKEYAVLKTTDNKDWTVDGWTPNEGDATIMKTIEGGVFNIKGLDSDDQYYLEEVAAPTGYNKLENPIDVMIATDGIDDPVNVAPQKINLVSQGKTTEGNPTSGTVSQDVVNKSGAGLPSTGGMGTIIFTVAGIAVMVVAAVVFVTRRRRSANLA